MATAICNAIGCNRQVPVTAFMCNSHWDKVWSKDKRLLLLHWRPLELPTKEYTTISNRIKLELRSREL